MTYSVDNAWKLVRRFVELAQLEYNINLYGRVSVTNTGELRVAWMTSKGDVIEQRVIKPEYLSGHYLEVVDQIHVELVPKVKKYRARLIQTLDEAAKQK